MFKLLSRSSNVLRITVFKNGKSSLCTLLKGDVVYTDKYTSQIENMIALKQIRCSEVKEDETISSREKVVMATSNAKTEVKKETSATSKLVLNSSKSKSSSK